MRGFGGIGGSGGGGSFGLLSHGRAVAYRGPEGSQSAYGRLGIAADAMTAARPWDATRGSTGFNAGRYSRGWAGPDAVAANGYGYAATEEPSAADQAGDFVGAYTSSQDVRVKIATLQAQIDNLEAIKAQTPRLLQGLLQGQIDVKRAKLAAYEEKLGLQIEGEQSWGLSRAITQTGGVVAIFAGVALTGLLVTLAVKNSRKVRKNGRRRNRARRSR